MAVKNQYFLKDKKAQIYRRVEGEPDNDGFPTGRKYFPIAPAQIWCYSRQLSQEDAFYSSRQGETETRMFVFNYYRNVKVYDMILYRDTWYRITRTDTQDDYNSALFVYVENAEGEWIPESGALQPFVPDIWKNE